MKKDKQWRDAVLKLVASLNNFDYKNACAVHECVPLLLKDQQIGVVPKDVWREVLRYRYPDAFQLQTSDGKLDWIRINARLSTVRSMDAAFEQLLEKWREQDLFVALRGWRDEKYSVYYRQGTEPLLNVERSACGLFGFIQYGVMINGYTYKDGQLMMWVGRRSKTKATYPNMLDNMCAGGLTQGLTPRECAIKECKEEASVDDTTLVNLKSVSSISYCYTDERGVLPENQFVFDLEVQADFVPKNADGEMQNFNLYTIEQVQEFIIAEEFKPNCALTIVNFLMRHGYYTHDDDPNYSYIMEKMHVSLQPSFD